MKRKWETFREREKMRNGDNIPSSEQGECFPLEPIKISHLVQPILIVVVFG